MATALRLMARLDRNGRRALYDDVLLCEYGELGAIELEPDPSTAGYYMPHHAVFKAESTTTKTRVVFNASASQAGCESLNALLDPGPSLLPSLAGLLIPFREQPVAVQTDIRKAFDMIGMKEADRRYLRFLWSDASGKMQVWRLARVPFGVNCSPLLLTAVLRTHLEFTLEHATPTEADVFGRLRDSLYVDDCIASVQTNDAARQFKKIGTACLETAGMDLRKWKCNVSLADDEVQSSGKVLGLCWNGEEDSLRIPVPPDCDDPTTKRQLLHCVASLYDPLGFASPYVLQGELFLKELWQEAVAWDDQVAASMQVLIWRWWGERTALQHQPLPRYLSCSTEAVIHLFVDASESGFGCCIYAMWPRVSELIFSKAKVAPMKQQTLALMELQAAFVGSR
ncbi:uncharacterized protein LOC135829110 [Sycon ciliatum]|uniref:uncharacterized protein LOC135829108 n=1 Tax=Sycon ciliatum TaxID=27933 RepID=UPI0031F62CE6